MNLWLKANPSFDNDEALEAFLCEAKGMLMIFDAPNRYNYQDVPKFLIYVMQMQMENFGDKPHMPFFVFGKQWKDLNPKFKKLAKWREQRKIPGKDKHDFYIDISQAQDRNF